MEPASNNEERRTLRNVQTFVFSEKTDEDWLSKKNVRAFVLSFCVSLISFPFGIMLGWPSPTYPKLLKPDAIIPITTDQSAMIAGFLMMGNIAGTPVVNLRLLGVSKGISMGLLLQLFGWILMAFASNIFWLLASRFFVGLGHGVGVQHALVYILGVCGEGLKWVRELPNLQMCAGIVVAFSIGNYVDFERFSMVAILVNVVVFCVILWLPQPSYLQGNYKFVEAQDLFKTNEKDAASFEQEVGLCGTLGNKLLRKNFVVLAFLTFFQQFSGLPATIVYCQILFTRMQIDSPEILAITYSIVFALCYVISSLSDVFLKKKLTLLFCNFLVCAILFLQALILYTFSDYKLKLLSLVIMFMYLFFHVLGPCLIPPTYIQNNFPKSARKFASQFYVMLFSALAIIITKIFQVLIDKYCVYVPLCLFSCVSLMGFVFTLVFFPNTPPLLL